MAIKNYIRMFITDPNNKDMWLRVLKKKLALENIHDRHKLQNTAYSKKTRAEIKRVRRHILNKHYSGQVL